MLRTPVTADMPMSHRILPPRRNYVHRFLLVPSWVTDVSNPTHPKCPQLNSWFQSIPSLWSSPSFPLCFAEIIPALVLDLSSVTTSAGKPLLPGQILLFHFLGTLPLKHCFLFLVLVLQLGFVVSLSKLSSISEHICLILTHNHIPSI